MSPVSAQLAGISVFSRSGRRKCIDQAIVALPNRRTVVGVVSKIRAELEWRGVDHEIVENARLKLVLGVLRDEHIVSGPRKLRFPVSDLDDAFAIDNEHHTIRSSAFDPAQA